MRCHGYCLNAGLLRDSECHGAELNRSRITDWRICSAWRRKAPMERRKPAQAVKLKKPPCEVAEAQIADMLTPPQKLTILSKGR